MIDSDFIIKYTNALYSTPTEFSPRYDEFRDMFSLGQVRSKEWIVKELLKLDIRYLNKNAIIAGAWYGTLGILIKSAIPDLNITMLDLDPRCEKFIHNIIYNDNTLRCITGDMYDYTYEEDIIINTSCEHIPDIKKWLTLLPDSSLLVLQSNNFFNCIGHVNCVNSKEEFIEKTGLTDVLYAGELVMEPYTRYMIIGKK